MEIKIMSHPSHEAMEYCIKIAKSGLEKGQYALAAIVVNNHGEVISENSSKLITSFDPTAHPEIIAIRQAANLQKSRYLHGCYLYTTLEPCPMCTAAAVWAKMEGVVFGAFQEDAIEYVKNHPSPVFTWRQITIPAHVIAEHGTPAIQVYGGILREKCKELFSLCY